MSKFKRQCLSQKDFVFVALLVMVFTISVSSITHAQDTTKQHLAKIDQPTRADLIAELEQLKVRVARIESLLAIDAEKSREQEHPKSVDPEESDKRYDKGNFGMVGTAKARNTDKDIVFHYQHGRVFANADVPKTLLDGGDFAITMRGQFELDKKTKVKVFMAGGGVNHDVNWIYINERELGSTGDNRSKHLVEDLELTKGTHDVRWLLTAGTFRSNILLIQDADGKMLPLTIRNEDQIRLKDRDLEQVRITSNDWGWPIPRDWIQSPGLGFSPIDNVTAAIAAFQTQSLGKLPKELSPEMKAFVIGQLTDTAQLYCKRRSCESYYQELVGPFSHEEWRQWIYFGDLDDLRTHSGDCWVIHSGGKFTEIGGCVDAETGKLLILLLLPEG